MRKIRRARLGKGIHPSLKRATIIITVGLSFLSACVTSIQTENQSLPGKLSSPTSPAPETSEITISPTITLPAVDISQLELEATVSSPTGLEKYSTIVPGEQAGVVPEIILEEIFLDLSQKLGVNPEEIQVVQAEAAGWNDGSLGCREPGMMYTQALVDGYRVVLAVGDQEYDYRVSDRGYFFLCQGSLLPGDFP